MNRFVQKLRDKILGRAPRTQPGQFRESRGRSVEWGVFALFGVISCRAVVLALFPAQSHALHQIADNQYQHEVELAPYRGGIYDHKGDPLAISVKRPSLAVNPHVFRPTPGEVARLAHSLRLPPAQIRRLIAKPTYFAWLARQLDQHVADDVMNLDLSGLVQINEAARFYPAGSSAAHLLGFIGLDNSGLAGLERQFDKDLRGKSYKVTTSKDARGNFIFAETAGTAPEKTGNNIYLTIDRVLQEIAEEELAVGVKASGAKRGFAVVSDPHTGRILALANYPSFDPNSTRNVNMALTRNSAVLDSFEPGSVIKPFVIGAALERKVTRPDEVHDCDKGALRIGKHTIHDDHAAESLTTAETLIRSSNICTYKIANRMGREATYNALRNFGFGSAAGLLGFPGETGGYMADWHKWATIRFANIAFGHGFVVTGLELVQAMGSIANGGHLMKPTLIERVVSSDGMVVTSTPNQVVRETIGPATARTMRGLLARVVTDPHGTGKKAATTEYTTAGKTGTAQKVEPGVKGYAKGKYVSGFIGFAPVGDPHLVAYVLIDEADQKHYHGAESAAPVFSRIIARSLKYLNVAPDIIAPVKSVPSKPATRANIANVPPVPATTTTPVVNTGGVTAAGTPALGSKTSAAPTRRM